LRWLLVFSTRAQADRFFAEHPQPGAAAIGVALDDVTLQMRQWVYGGVEYFVVDPAGGPATWEPRPVSAFKEALPGLLDAASRNEAVAQTDAVVKNATELAGFKTELHAKLFPGEAPVPPPPEPPKPWYEKMGLE
jgi:hypothetical protein